MAIIRSFKGLRPTKDLAQKVASRPYDVLNSEEAREEAIGNEVSFLHVCKSEIDLPADIDHYAESVYQKAKENLQKFIAEGILIRDVENCLYIYQQIMPVQEADGTIKRHKQTGIVANSSIEDYFNDIIKKHEYTRPEKENDRIKHMATLQCHPEPVFLTYPDVAEIDVIINSIVNNNLPEYNFTADDGIQHIFWVVNNIAHIEALISMFTKFVPYTYIADGHHRSASSAKVGKKLAENNPNHTGEEEYNYFLSVLFPASQLMIMDYNRVIIDLNGHRKEEIINSLSQNFIIEKQNSTYKPEGLHNFGMYIDNEWYKLTAKESTYDNNDPIAILDVTILSDYILDPIFNIKDQRTDKRIDFVGGIRGLGELEKRVNSGEMQIAFSLFPVSIQQLINIADSGNVMPPKSTWFEPKLRSGLVVHTF